MGKRKGFLPYVYSRYFSHDGGSHGDYQLIDHFYQKIFFYIIYCITKISLRRKVVYGVESEVHFAIYSKLGCVGVAKYHISNFVFEKWYKPLKFSKVGLFPNLFSSGVVTITINNTIAFSL